MVCIWIWFVGADLLHDAHNEQNEKDETHSTSQDVDDCHSSLHVVVHWRRNTKSATPLSKNTTADESITSSLGVVAVEELSVSPGISRALDIRMQASLAVQIESGLVWPVHPFLSGIHAHDLHEVNMEVQSLMNEEQRWKGEVGAFLSNLLAFLSHFK